MLVKADFTIPVYGDDDRVLFLPQRFSGRLRQVYIKTGDRFFHSNGCADLGAGATAYAVREVVDELQHRGATEHVFHVKVNRPWGSYTVLEEDPDGFKIKRIEVAPGARLSLQSHRKRSEHWVVVSGTATVTNGDEVVTVQKNQSTYIPIGTKHRLENQGSEPLHIVEIQVGEYLGEVDIQRYEDTYGR